MKHSASPTIRDSLNVDGSPLNPPSQSEAENISVTLPNKNSAETASMPSVHITQEDQDEPPV